jgi:hypothetical protein
VCNGARHGRLRAQNRAAPLRTLSDLAAILHTLRVF